MANWIRIEKSTPYKQEIAEIARALHISTHEAFVRCFLVWSWADTESVDGFLKGIDLYGVDGVAGRRGFADVMVKVGWLAQRSDGVEIPEFLKHMGSSQKKRDRQRRWREKKKSVDASETPTETRTSPSLSVFGLGCSKSQEKTENPDSGGVQGGAPTPYHIAAQWCYLLTRRRSGYPADSPDDIAVQVAELMRLGHEPAKVLADVMDPKRDRNEQFFRLHDRITGAKNEATNGYHRNGQTPKRTNLRYDPARDG